MACRRLPESNQLVGICRRKHVSIEGACRCADVADGSADVLDLSVGHEGLSDTGAVRTLGATTTQYQAIEGREGRRMRHGLAAFGRKCRACSPWLTLRGITSEVQRAVLPDGAGKVAPLGDS